MMRQIRNNGGILIALMLALCGLAEASADKPNILFILMDDQGWGSLSCYGNRHVRTPNLNRIASEGMRFTDACVIRRLHRRLGSVFARVLRVTGHVD